MAAIKKIISETLEHKGITHKVHVIDEAIQRYASVAKVKVINETVQRYATVAKVKIINEKIQRFSGVFVINEGSQLREGSFRRTDSYPPTVKVINETTQIPQLDATTVTAIPIVQVIAEFCVTTETIKTHSEYNPVVPTVPYTPGVRGRKSFRKWADCAICGFSYPVNELFRQRGVLVCKDDLDEKSHSEYRRDAESHEEEPREAPWAVDGDD